MGWSQRRGPSFVTSTSEWSRTPVVPLPCETRVTTAVVAPLGTWKDFLILVHSPAGGTVARWWNSRSPSARTNSATTSALRSDR